MSTHEWQRRCECLVELIEASAWAHDVQDVYQRMVDVVGRMFCCRQAHMHLLTADGEGLERKAFFDLTEERDDWLKGTQATLSLGEGRVRWLIKNKRPAVSDFMNPHENDCVSEKALALGCTWSVSFPMFVGSAVYGMCSLLFDTPFTWMEADSDFSVYVGRTMGSAIARIRASEESVELRILEDRRATSFEISDNLSQMIGNLALTSDLSLLLCEEGDIEGLRESLSRLGKISRESMGLLRTEAFSWSAPLYITDGFVGEIESCLSRFRRIWDFDSKLSVDVGEEPLLLSTQVASQLMRIMRECLADMLSLSYEAGLPPCIEVSLTSDGEYFAMSIDETSGSVSANANSFERMGLRVMTERAHAIGGRLVALADNNTASLCIDIPLSALVSNRR